MQNSDGTATCDRCRRALPAFGVLHGMVSIDLRPDGSVRSLIVCHLCRPTVLTGLVNYPQAGGQPTRCVHCNLAKAYAVSDGLLITDLAPAAKAGDPPRRMILCYTNGSAALYLAHLSL